MQYNKLHNAVRKHIEQEQDNVILWDVLQDESQDPTLLSLRAYGTREHADIVMITCGVSGVWQTLPCTRIVLPLLKDVIALKRQFNSN